MLQIIYTQTTPNRRCFKHFCYVILHFFGYTNLTIYFLFLNCHSLYVTNHIFTQITPKDVVLNTFVMSKTTSFWLFNTKQNMLNMFSSWFNILHCLWLSFSPIFLLFLFFRLLKGRLWIRKFSCTKLNKKQPKLLEIVSTN